MPIICRKQVTSQYENTLKHEKMNIIITLPSDLIAAIVSRRKQIEFRKCLPKHFNPVDDWVYVIEKGTKNVVARFRVMYFQKEYDPIEIWHTYGRLIWVSFEWFVKYTSTAKIYYLWHISEPEYLEKPLHRGAFFGLSCNPQSYVYTRLTIK